MAFYSVTVVNVIYLQLSIMRVLAQVQIKDFTRTEFIEIITNKNAEFKVPPNYDIEEPTVVECEILVDSFDSISEANMDFTVTVFLHLSWPDTRFTRIYPKIDNDLYIEIDSKNLDKLWIPDLYFPNEKKAYYHDVFMPNKMLRIYRGGNVTYSTRLTLTLTCNMNLRNYPFDRQSCAIEMESFSYNEHNIILMWANRTEFRSAVELVGENKDSLPQFEVKDIILDEFFRPHSGSGNHSCVAAKFVLERNLGYYIVQMYVPSILVVMLSWISFWLNANSVPGRISLGVLTVLTMTTQSSSVNASLPRVSYTKAIDIWMSTCLIFVFFALIEFAMVNFLTRMDMNKGVKIKTVFQIPADPEKNTPNKEVIVNDKEAKEKEESSTRSPRKKIASGVLLGMRVDVASRILFPTLFIIFNIVYWSYFNAQMESQKNPS
ncbi:hypothetical protein ACJMK2_032355 [Sinanodonta woodiana]|uniref:Uncharacterized protein n=1 Tax=Sinanodonta woodiana TaxID=1069815 RepID=A0ABD3X1G1_SINWO